jgi:hypothetical protein
MWLRVMQNRCAPVMVRQQPEIFCWTLTGRRSRSAWLLSLFRYRHNDNYADVPVMPMLA